MTTELFRDTFPYEIMLLTLFWADAGMGWEIGFGLKQTADCIFYEEVGLYSWLGFFFDLLGSSYHHIPIFCSTLTGVTKDEEAGRYYILVPTIF